MKKKLLESRVYEMFCAALSGGVLGAMVGQPMGFRWQPVSGETMLIPIIVMVINGVMLAWLTREKVKSVGLLLVVIIGLVIGAFVGSVMGGIVGTIISIPFGARSFTYLFLTVSSLGMLGFGVGVPMFLIRILDKS